MARLLVFIENREIDSLPLAKGQEYVLGRGERCDVILPPEKGVSRQHLKLIPEGAAWRVQVLSRYGELTMNNQKIAELTLNQNCEFSITPFRFQFFAEVIEVTPVSTATFDERTIVKILPLIPYLRLHDQQGNVLQSFRLEGEAWTAGRETTCSIFIDNPKISRRQFEIYRNEHVYFVRDLGSANGTLVNGEAISSEEWTPLNSGDVIQIVDWSLQFELRDAEFEHRLEQAHPIINSPIVYSASTGSESSQDIPRPSLDRPTPEFAFVPPVSYPRPVTKKSNWVRIATAGIAVVGVLAYLLQDGAPSKETGRAPAEAARSSPFDKLPPDQQQYVRQSYKLAKDLYMQGRYEMARQEILKIYKIIPAYEDSREIEASAVQAIQMQQEKARLEAQEREKIEIEEKIQRQVAICRRKITPAIEVTEIDECLAPVIQFNPEHTGIQELKSQVDKIISDRNIKQAMNSDYRDRVQKQKALFENAVSLSRRVPPRQGIKALEAVLESKLPDPQNLKSQARREIASIQQKMSTQQAELEREADSAYQKGDLKNTIVTLKKALQINPDNEAVKGRISTVMAELKKQMQTFYQEGILEESVGEVETAKTKWKKIIERSLPEEDYYKKAAIKLKKYGAI